MKTGREVTYLGHKREKLSEAWPVGPFAQFRCAVDWLPNTPGCHLKLCVKYNFYILLNFFFNSVLCFMEFFEWK